jgi:hypothetical protein
MALFCIAIIAYPSCMLTACCHLDTAAGTLSALQTITTLPAGYADRVNGADGGAHAPGDVCCGPEAHGGTDDTSWRLDIRCVSPTPGERLVDGHTGFAEPFFSLLLLGEGQDEGLGKPCGDSSAPLRGRRGRSDLHPPPSPREQTSAASCVECGVLEYSLQRQRMSAVRYVR